MRNVLFVTAAAAVLTGCAALPQKTAMQLATTDRKFNSPECMAIREKALTYDDKVGERMAIGFATGLLLGPVGIPIAAAADAAQNEQRAAFNREIELRCMTNPPKHEELAAEPKRAEKD